MTIKRLTSQGVGAVAVILILVLLGIVGSTAYYVYHANKNTNSTLSAAAKDTQTAPKFSNKKKGSVSASTQSTAVSKEPPVASTPTSGACGGPSSTSQATITVEASTPVPRCQKVEAQQTLLIVNSTSQTVAVKLGSQTLTVAPGKSQSIDKAFGDYLEPGVHDLSISAYAGGSGAEIWLQ